MVRMLWIALALLVLALQPLWLNGLQLHVMVEIFYLALFALSFNLLFGYAGLLSFGHNAVYGVSAYALAYMLLQHKGMGLMAGIGFALLVSAAVGGLLGILCVRLKGGYFALLTLAFAQFFLVLANKWRSFTKGDDGLMASAPSLDLPFAGPISLSNGSNLYWFALVVSVLACALAYGLMRTPLGNAVLLIRENEERARYLGYNVVLTKWLLFVASSLLAGMAGVLFMLAQGVVTPGIFSIASGGDVLIITLLGGTSGFFGPILGVAAYHLLQDLLSRATEHWPFFMGLILVLVVLFAPGGIYGILQRVMRRVREARHGHP